MRKGLYSHTELMRLFKLFQLRFLIFVVYLPFINCIFGQETNLNSPGSKSIKELSKLDGCLKHAVLYMEKYSKPDSVLYYSTEARQLSQQFKSIYALNKADLYIAIAFQQKNQFDTSIVLLINLLTRVGQSNDSLKADIYYYLGIANYRWGDKKKSLEFFIMSIPLYKKVQNMDGLSLAYCKLADVLVTDSQNKEANSYKYQAIALLPKQQNPYAKIFARNLISRIYMDLRSMAPTYIDSSIVYAKESYALMQEFGYYTRAFQVLNIISDNYFIKEDYETGIQFTKESLKYRSNLYPGELILAYAKFSDYYMYKKDYKTALVYLDSFKIQLPKINVQYYWLQYYQRFFDLNKKAGNLNEAIYGIEHYNAIKDSLYNVEKSKEINELAQKYNKIENEKKIMELSKEKEIASINAKFYVMGIVASVFAIVVIIFFYRQTLIKSKLKSIETEQRLNRARMDPHFFFNILTSLRAFTLKENDSVKTADYLTKYSKIMRQTLESSYNEQITIEIELEFLTNYFAIQKLRYPGRFNYEIKIGNDLEVAELLLPSMIIQPFVENSIEHGFSDTPGNGMIYLSFEIKSDELKITISDNGVGLNINSDLEKAYPSRATQIVKDRLYLLNEQYKSNARFEVQKNMEAGIRVNVYLPLIYKA